MSAHVLLNLLNELGKSDKCEACHAFYPFSIYLSSYTQAIIYDHFLR